MTPRNIFNVILKVLGLLFIDDILAISVQLISAVLYFSKSDTSQRIWTVTTTLMMLAVYVITTYFLIFKSTFLIDKLKLGKGFNQDIIPLNIHRSTVLSISIIVIGGLIIVNEIPNLCRQLFSYYQEKRMTYGQTKPTISYSVLATSKIIIGLLLLTNQKHIVNFIERKRMNNGS